ncbi:metallophosphoesterase [Methylobacterium radiodurans]|uniref:Metallophosphoesterase n=1 Tax=Methylobacterium radiodurans TaxID=2202828 RepID=A0A2U8VLN2_9HYPH|nr:metallophosphoesterase [Methylobacterium radiodurans]AWN34388.1 metallophosphoesterase [Methylobacterium radiodurans]
MSRQLFVSDTHFGHAGILSPRMQAPRPFASIEEHDEALVANWNTAVRPEDTVWHLGDFCYRCPEERALAIFRRLNGRKLLVRGNHDKVGARLPWDAPVVDVARTVVPDPVTGAPVGIFMFHYACRVWPRMHRGDIHLYGHSHGTLPGTAASTDVGVDCFGFRPATFDQIRVRLAENTAG